MAAELRSRNAELREQRETNARLAVAVDRQRIADDLNVAVRSRLDELAQAAAYADPADEDATREAFSRVQQMGRETLTHMREVVGALRPPTSSAPAPVLAQLGELLSRATSADARLVVSGQPESLPAGVELSGYRIVEHLLVALEDAPDARIDVAVTFTAESLEIAVRGPAAPRAERVAALAAARERTALHGGTLDATTKSGRCEAVVRLPLIAARA
jgi:signal transduction histidine kinase